MEISDDFGFIEIPKLNEPIVISMYFLEIGWDHGILTCFLLGCCLPGFKPNLEVAGLFHMEIR